MDQTLLSTQIVDLTILGAGLSTREHRVGLVQLTLLKVMPERRVSGKEKS